MDALRQEGVFCFKVHGSALMMAGLPDIIACVEGKFVGLETKVPEMFGNVSERQKFVHQQIQESGGWTVVVTSPESALTAIRSIRAGRF
jgi:hypothetical protein